MLDIDGDHVILVANGGGEQRRRELGSRAAFGHGLSEKSFAGDDDLLTAHEYLAARVRKASEKFLDVRGAKSFVDVGADAFVLGGNESGAGTVAGQEGKPTAGSERFSTIPPC